MPAVGCLMIKQETVSLSAAQVATLLTVHFSDQPSEIVEKALGNLTLRSVRSLCRDILTEKGTNVLKGQLNSKYAYLYSDVVTALRGIVECTAAKAKY